SYMVLPEPLAEIFQSIKSQYDQTSSKTEQLTLALYMERGYYGIHLKKLRTLYAQKLKTALRALEKNGSDFLITLNRSSGIHIPLVIRLPETVPDHAAPEISRRLCSAAETLRLKVLPLPSESAPGKCGLLFYYNQIPLEEISDAVKEMTGCWRQILNERCL
ncbi:MAG: hypothetical protein ACFNYI_02165, partial [Eubacterium sp.]